MGVSGSGKSLIGAALARTLGADFVEGDEYHSAQNVERMSRGIALTDEDRFEWLQSLATRIRDADDDGKDLVLTCSALKRSYRDILRSGSPNVQFIFLKGSRPLIAERLVTRRGHFMPPSLLDSQFAILEEPSPDEHAWVCDVNDSPSDIVTSVMARTSA